MIENETILYQNDQPSGDTITLNLSESYKNFEYILFGYFDSNNYLGFKQVPVEIMNSYVDIFLGGVVGDKHNNAHVAASINIFGETQIQQRNKSSSYTKITFIKGLNRKV